ncbi:MAG TPA: ferredoxin--NADP reductase [Polyangiaceae bacterium]|jgi:ferredoxin--NADP+ reductase|nr:ferredoxin--NADP reductase [Polyangiaceae bacterium]
MAWVESKVARRRVWADGLMSLTLDRTVSPFVPGQYINLGLDLAGERQKRSYSIASGVGKPTELYLSRVPGGVLTPALFELGEGDPLWVDDRPLGFFTLQYVPEARHLWLVATGTGLGPFLAMLEEEEIWRRFSRVVLVHGVRELAHLGYSERLAERARERPAQFAYVPLVTREAPPPGGLQGRVPQLIESGELESRAGLQLEPETTHVLLCGNPNMLSDAQTVLAARGLVKHRPRKPGHVSVESYW